MITATLTIFGFISGVALGFCASFVLLRSKLLNAQRTGRMIAGWWIAAEDRLEKIHQARVRAGRTPHERRRERVKDVAAQIAISPPSYLRPRDEIVAEGRDNLAKRRRGNIKVAA